MKENEKAGKKITLISIFLVVSLYAVGLRRLKATDILSTMECFYE